MRSEFQDPLEAGNRDNSHSLEDLCLVQFEWPETALQTPRQHFYTSKGGSRQMGRKRVVLELLSLEGQGPSFLP